MLKHYQITIKFISNNDIESIRNLSRHIYKLFFKCTEYLVIKDSELEMKEIPDEIN